MALLGRFRHLRYFRFGWERTLVNQMPVEVSWRPGYGTYKFLCFFDEGWSLARRLGGPIFRNLAANSSRVSSTPRFRAATINRSNCAGSVLPGRFFRFATTFAIRTTQLRMAAPADSYHLNTSLRTKMPMSSTSRTTMTMNSIMDAGLPCSASVTKKPPVQLPQGLSLRRGENRRPPPPRGDPSTPMAWPRR
jgi:hypothetical protein